MNMLMTNGVTNMPRNLWFVFH